jgi:hypothetical protein
MKNSFFFALVALWLTMIGNALHAQQTDFSIRGKVTALEDGIIVRQASVTIDRKGVGTATNAAGLFILTIPATNYADTLKISCVGFKTKYIPISGLKNSGELHIELEKSSRELKEVTITYYDGPKIIRKAIDRIPENYINHPHILRGFYRMYTYNDQNPLQLSEAVFDVYNFGYADTRADLFKLVKARRPRL